MDSDFKGPLPAVTVGFYFQDLCIDESGVLKFLTITVCGALCVLSFTKVSLMNVDALAFVA